MTKQKNDMSSHLFLVFIRCHEFVVYGIYDDMSIYVAENMTAIVIWFEFKSDFRIS